MTSWIGNQKLVCCSPLSSHAYDHDVIVAVFFAIWCCHFQSVKSLIILQVWQYTHLSPLTRSVVNEFHKRSHTENTIRFYKLWPCKIAHCCTYIGIVIMCILAWKMEHINICTKLLITLDQELGYLMSIVSLENGAPKQNVYVQSYR